MKDRVTGRTLTAEERRATVKLRRFASRDDLLKLVQTLADFAETPVARSLLRQAHEHLKQQYLELPDDDTAPVKNGEF